MDNEPYTHTHTPHAHAHHESSWSSGGGGLWHGVVAEKISQDPASLLDCHEADPSAAAATDWSVRTLHSFQPLPAPPVPPAALTVNAVGWFIGSCTQWQ